MTDNKVIIRGERSASISAIRFISMLMIIACHMFQYYDNELCRWFNVGVQVFFVISGFLYGTKEIEDPIVFIKKTFTKILIPYWVFLLIAILVYSIVCPYELSLFNSFKAFICAGTISGLGHLWFVGYILFCYLITPYLFWLRKHHSSSSLMKCLLVYIAVLLLIQVLAFAYNSYFMPDRISCYIIGYFSVDLIARFGSKVKRGLICFFVVLAVLTNVVEVYFKYIGSFELSASLQTMFKVWCHYAHLFLGVALFFVMNEMFMKAKYTNLLKASDRYSYPIYIVHLLFILSPLSLMTVTGLNIVNWAIVLVLVVSAGVLLKWISGIIDMLIIQKQNNN